MGNFWKISVYINFLCLFGIVIEAQNTYPVLSNGWHVHDAQRPLHEKVLAGKNNAHPPSDAIILFNGNDFNQWESLNNTSIEWELNEDYMEVVPQTGNIQTKKALSDIQLHIEWAIPNSAFSKGNRKVISGIFLMGLYKIQIVHDLDESYADGMEGAIYGQNPPLVNVSKKIGEWQSYDIIFKAPVFHKDKLIFPANVTILQNGVLIQNHTEIYGPAAYRKIEPYAVHPEKLPLMLQDHGSSVRYRNIWVRELDKNYDFKPLFDGKTLAGWKSGRHPKGESHGVFTVNEAESAIHAYSKQEAGSEQEIDVLYTDETFSNYILKMEYKWGTKRFAPRGDFDRDAGLLFHIGEEITKGWKGWPDSFEMQIGETPGILSKKNRYHTGDAWIIGLQNTAEITSKEQFYAPNKPLQLLGKDKRFQGCFTRLGKEKPFGEWNEIMIKVEGGKKAYFFLNGEKVMEISNMKSNSGDSETFVKSGRIGLQAEWAEVYYRNILIKEIP